MIEVKEVTLLKSGQKLFQQLDLTIAQTDHLLIQGANGSGKTSLLELLAGNLTAFEGTITYNFVTGSSWEERYQQRKQFVHYIPADAALTQIHQHELFYQQRYYSLGDELVPTVSAFLGEELVKRLHSYSFPASLAIDHLLSLKLTRLSNGQQKRVMIMKTLAQQIPKVLLLDYPFEALDRQSRKDLCDFLDFLASKHNVQIILTDHDAELPQCINRKIWMEEGKLLTDFYHAAPLSHATSPTTSVIDGSEKKDTIVEMKDLTIQYGESIILKNFNWTIHKGERWALAGKNGSGKTTLFSLIFADHPLAYSQQVFLFGKRRGSGESIWDIKNRITYLGPEQMSYLDPRDKLLTAKAYILPLHRGANDEEKLDKLIQYFDAASFVEKPLRQLSAGQLQLILIMKCFLSQKELLLLDEPFRFLDPLQKERVNQYLQSHLNEQTTLVLITHDEKDMERWGEHIMRL